MKKNINKFVESIYHTVQIIGPMSLHQDPSPQIPTIIVDGGLCHKLSFKNSITIGDGDSYEGQDVEDLFDIILNKDKDYSDLSFALSLLKDMNIENIYFHGFTNGRKDHEFINILEAHEYLNNKSNCQINIDKSLIIFSKGEYEFDYLGTFSVVTLNHNEIDLRGEIKYSYSGILREKSSHGLSNESFGKIKVKCNQPLILYIS